jgi:hypothetical protein
MASLVATGALAGSDGTAVDAARRDLAARLKLNVEAVTVAPRSADDLLEAERLCRRTSAPVTRPDVEAEGGGTTLILFAEGKRHYYHAWPGEPYHYCELPSTKKTGAGWPPVR